MGEVEVGGLCGNAKLVCLMVPCNGGGKKTNVSYRSRLSQGNHDYLGSGLLAKHFGLIEVSSSITNVSS